jgi:hypothetical protein
MWTPKRFFSPEQVEAAMTARGGFSRQSLANSAYPSRRRKDGARRSLNSL